MIYLHGGGYFKNILFEHWMFIRKLIKKSNITVIVFNYPLVPGHTFRDVFISLYGFYTDLINKKDPLLMEHARKKIIMAGDSAGGALALAFSMHLRNLGERLPEKLLLFSPFLDASCSNPQIKELAENDLILHAGGARAAGRLYAGQTKTNSPDSGLKHWMISPFYGDLQGLPDIDLFGGSCEIFRPDIERFHEMLIKAGQKSRLYIKEGMQHVYMIFAIPEADETIENISFFENNNYCSGIGK
jgi:acetyl esterase/lipase